MPKRLLTLDETRRQFLLLQGIPFLVHLLLTADYIALLLLVQPLQRGCCGDGC